MSILQTIDLKKYYGTKPNITRALDGVNFSVNDGEFVAVVGTSGSGKSTHGLAQSYFSLSAFKFRFGAIIVSWYRLANASF